MASDDKSLWSSLTIYTVVNYLPWIPFYPRFQVPVRFAQQALAVQKHELFSLWVHTGLVNPFYLA